MKARPLPPPVNGPGNDTSGWVSRDGKMMLLALDARGGSGGTDLFVTHQKAGTWSLPVNLGSAVNSASADFGAVITPDGRNLVFSSTRRFGSTRAGLIQVWTVPVEEAPALGR